MKIYLIRHGKTPANEQHLYCGSTDISLSAAGIQELRSLSYSVDTGRFVTSGMKRTNETLAILFGDVAYRVEPAFREIDFGSFEMKSYEDLKANPEYQAWISGDNEANIPPNGESGIQMTERVMRAYHALSEDSVVLTHGGVIAAIMATLFPEDRKSRYQWQPRPGHGYVIEDDTYRPIP